MGRKIMRFPHLPLSPRLHSPDVLYTWCASWGTPQMSLFWTDTLSDSPRSGSRGMTRSCSICQQKQAAHEKTNKPLSRYMLCERSPVLGSPQRAYLGEQATLTGIRGALAVSRHLRTPVLCANLLLLTQWHGGLGCTW